MVTHPSAAATGPVQTSESSPVRDRRSTTEPPNQLCRATHYLAFRAPLELTGPRSWPIVGLTVSLPLLALTIRVLGFNFYLSPCI